MTDDRGHPTELLAEYVDGSLGRDDLAEVERHLAGCEACREEVELASRAQAALAGLPEVDAPPGLDLAVRRETRRPVGRGWRMAGVAAVAAAVLAGAVVVGRAVLTGDGGQSTAGAPQSSEERADQDQEAAAEPQPSPGMGFAEDGAALSGDPGSIRFRASPQDYTPPTLVNLGRRLAEEADRALQAGFPPTANEFYEGFEINDLREEVRLAAVCALQEVPPDQPVVPFLIQEASFRGDPAFVAAFLQGPAPSAPYDRLLIWVVHRESCALLYFASFRL
jgi:hypothetical protein